MGSLSLLQANFPTQGSKRGLLHCRQILYQLNYPGSHQNQRDPRNHGFPLHQGRDGQTDSQHPGQQVTPPLVTRTLWSNSQVAVYPGGICPTLPVPGPASPCLQTGRRNHLTWGEMKRIEQLTSSRNSRCHWQSPTPSLPSPPPKASCCHV